MSNSSVIDAVVVVDTEGLRAAYPNGVSKGNTIQLNSFFNILVDSEHHNGSEGISCIVGDKLNFRAIPKTNTNNSVIISEFADTNASSSNLTNYISPPSFRTSIREAYSYDNSAFPTPSRWSNWELWYATLQPDTQVEDSHMGLEALKSTASLSGGCISYTLGFRVTYPGGVNLDFYFDPTITIG